MVSVSFSLREELLFVRLKSELVRLPLLLLLTLVLLLLLAGNFVVEVRVALLVKLAVVVLAVVVEPVTFNKFFVVAAVAGAEPVVTLTSIKVVFVV